MAMFATECISIVREKIALHENDSDMNSSIYIYIIQCLGKMKKYIPYISLP